MSSWLSIHERKHGDNAHFDAAMYCQILDLEAQASYLTF